MDDASLSQWLRQRELADWQSRSTRVTEVVRAMLPPDRVVNVLDLASGEGSNLRYLADRLPERQRWLLADRSAMLLSQVEQRTRTWAADRNYRVASGEGTFTILGRALDCRVQSVAVDLGALDESALFDGRNLVTASALLDLVSEPWLRSLAAQCHRVGAAALFAITYDGRFSCDPVEPEDDTVRALMNDHQRRDKGLGGPAEGPGAAVCAVRCFEAAGYDVLSDRSDWMLGPGQGAMQRTLIDGWAEAAAEVAPADAPAIESWRLRRLAHVDAQRSRVTVGHVDLAAWREERRTALR